MGRFAADDFLYLIEQGTASATGTEFLRQLVRHLAKARDARYAFICEYIERRRQVRDLAFWADDGFQANGEYEIDGTPCELVLAGEMKCYPDNVAVLFPKYQWLAEVGAKSYLAVPLKGPQGWVLGHLGVMDVKPMGVGERAMRAFNIFAARACAELERLCADRAATRSEQRLSTVLASAMDAIITFDETRHITLFNQAAERIFGCAAAWAIGQPFDRFLSKRFRGLIDRYLKALEPPLDTPQQMWAPEGLTALRADREEFPIEATISPVELGGERYYTVILRDVNERRRTEALLQRLQWENAYLQEAARSALGFQEIVGESPRMKALYTLIAQVAAADTTVLITGEMGTGKELIGQAIHNLSARRDKLLIKVNCAALPAELFGHERGAFTGATMQRKGRFELADGSSLFLDEVGELSLQAQAKLLRVLQEQEFERVGGSQSLRVDVRVIAATNRNLSDAVQAGTFRADLYFRLNVFPIEAPPLRERCSDIPLLARHFLAQCARKLGKPLRDASAPSLAWLERYDWPGNVRELQNVIERAAVLTRGPLVEVEGLTGPVPEARGTTRPRTLEELQRVHILKVLEERDWVIEGGGGAAAVLGLGPSTLRYRMQKLGIKRPGAHSR
jgi:PAS domain S-box-containing protein